MRDRHRKSADLRRRSGRRQPRQRVLIVCEGEKTERNYFEEIRQAARLSTAEVYTVQSELGTDPENVVRSAEKAFQDKNKAFDQVYAVFDRDDHRGYANAIAMAIAKNGKLRNAERKPVTFRPVPSVPCFELWLLLHFDRAEGPLPRTDVFRRLKTSWPGYAKNSANAYATTNPTLNEARTRAAALRRNVGPLPGTDCYTDVDELVALLLALNT